MILRGTPRFGTPSRVLIVQLRRIGDVLLGTPALRALATRFPEAKIDFMVEPPADEVLWGHPLIDRLLVVPRDRRLGTFLHFAHAVRERRYDWAIDFLSNPRSAQFTFVSGARVRVGLDRRGRRWAYTHHIVEEDRDRDAYAADLRLEVLARMGAPATGRRLEIYCDRAAPEETGRVESLLGEMHGAQPLVAVSTGSANPAKRYPADLTVEVIRGLRDHGYEVILTAGPGERDLAEEILVHTAPAVAFLAEARVPTLAALYRRVQLYVGPDSGPKHVAAACGLPTVTIFGPGRPGNWNDPENPRNIVLVAPCEVRPHCVESECAQRQCLRRIPPAQVVAAALDLIGK
jgi:heptosyltransferase-3